MGLELRACHEKHNKISSITRREVSKSQDATAGIMLGNIQTGRHIWSRANGIDLHTETNWLKLANMLPLLSELHLSSYHCLQCLYAVALTLIIAPPYKEVHSWNSYCDGIGDTDYSFISEWNLGGFPAWLLAMNPSLNLRSFDLSFLQLVGGHINMTNGVDLSFGLAHYGSSEFELMVEALLMSICELKAFAFEVTLPIVAYNVQIYALWGGGYYPITNFTLQLSRANSVVILLTYLAYIFFQLKE
ncbi:beta-galactosidase 17-like [Senna tora]|uniref:Beta-galactosidase 17-like n=1 Tax=Senna tora TaxID=362788 RepID=A0A834TRC8_9FABA|nr:beta-galactosidase 17-like [Senna tora]